MFIEMLDYGVTIDSQETVNYFRNFPDRGSIGYFSFEDAEADRNPLGNVEKYIDIVEDFISAGLIGDHYIFTNEQVSEIISEYERWNWTPETGIVPWDEPVKSNRPNRKQRRSARRDQNRRHKAADRNHGKRGKKAIEAMSRKRFLEADGYDHPTFKVIKGKLRPIHDVQSERLNGIAATQFIHEPWDEDPWTFVDELPDPLPEEQKYDFWESWDYFTRTTDVRIENAEIWKARFGKNAWHFVLEETGTVYWEDENGQHASNWERETVIY